MDMPEVYSRFCSLLEGDQVSFSSCLKDDLPTAARYVVESLLEPSSVLWELGSLSLEDGSVCLRLHGVERIGYVFVRTESYQWYYVSPDLKERLHPDEGMVVLMENSFPPLRGKIEVLPDRTVVIAGGLLRMTDELVGDARILTSYRGGEVVDVKTIRLSPEVARMERSLREESVKEASRKKRNRAKRERQSRA